MTHFMRMPAPEERRTTVLLAAAAGAALWGAAMAAQAGDQPTPQPAADAHSAAPAATKPTKVDPDDRVICRDEDAPTGSRLGATRICHTQRVWKQMARDGQDWLDSVDRQNPQGSRGN